MSTFVALKNACLQTVDGMRGSPSQMRIAAALLATKRRDKFVILHNKVSFSTRALDPAAPRGARPPSLAPAPHSSRSPDQMIMIGLEDGEERATSTASAKFR